VVVVAEGYDRLDHAHLSRCMERIAAGDHAFVFTFIEAYGDRVEGSVRRVLIELGRRDVLLDRQEIDSLVIDACLVIAEKASGWGPGGAAPWNWAYLAIRSSIAHTIRRQALIDETDLEGHVEAGPTADLDVTPEIWARLAQQYDEVGLLDEALSIVASERDRWLFIEYLTQQGGGDPSPAVTLGAMYGLRPEAVRQIVRRQRQRLRRHTEANGRYAALQHLDGLGLGVAS
jgi:hypothetical protein